MSSIAAKHKNDTISLALTRTAEKLNAMGRGLSKKLDSTDNATIKYYLSNKNSL